jgi:hypothetical protein
MWQGCGVGQGHSLNQQGPAQTSDNGEHATFVLFFSVCSTLLAYPHFAGHTVRGGVLLNPTGKD